MNFFGEAKGTLEKIFRAAAFVLLTASPVLAGADLGLGNNNYFSFAIKMWSAGIDAAPQALVDGGDMIRSTITKTTEFGLRAHDYILDEGNEVVGGITSILSTSASGDLSPTMLPF